LPVRTGIGTVLRATATGGVVPLQYQFWVNEPGTGWRILQPWGAASSVPWTPTKAGAYAVQVWMRNAGSTAAYDAWQGIGPFDVADGPLQLVDVTMDATQFVAPGSTVTWTAVRAGDGAAPVEYQFFLHRQPAYDPSGGSWTLVRPWSPSSSWSFAPGPGDADQRFYVQVWARRQGSTAAWEAWANSTQDTIVSSGPVLYVGLRSNQNQTSTPDGRITAPVGTFIQWRAIPTLYSHGPVEYAFWRQDLQSGIWTQLQPYGVSDMLTWTPSSSEVGVYWLQVWGRTVGSTVTYEAWAQQLVYIQP